ncbi:nucleotidyltransferase domain-containing protein [Pseudoduganella chitinolytica]|uniref:Nucleotidyltransferase domain-containing protein n=1 Tax=Pseudoduganella chitinolytica TaxID=34070 RepID=A0ABY8BA16_9BURK|nr:nucleotidyltransferase domain-containing protein [Pseudoduganella chitinolytica]WEF31219.1 nucleotidyltransferase domain-containing protein [Pseudoduganella chitinolytica]
MHIDAATKLVRTELLPRWPDAAVAIIGGSIARGEATPTSDIDLLLVFEHVEQAWRDTFKVGTQTVELFGHDLATFDYFCRVVDGPAGRMPLAAMVNDGASVLPDSALLQRLRRHARKLYDAGPPALSAEALARQRYAITTLLEDLADSTTPDETLAIAVHLYGALADFALRAAGTWTGHGRHLARRLKATAPALAADLETGMALLAAQPEMAKAAFDRAVRTTLAPHGGLLLEGFRLPAPAAWRSAEVPD